MELQNINLDYENTTYSSLADGKVYMLELTQIMDDFKASIEADYSTTVKRLVVQITFDQSLSDPRIVINSGEEDFMIISLQDLESNFPATHAQYLQLEQNVLEQINEQTNQNN